MQYLILKEKKEVLRILRLRKKELIHELRDRRQAKRDIDEQIADIKREIKHIKGDPHDF